MNPAKSIPIEKSYINLAIVEIKEQREQEKKLRDAQHNDAIIGTFEQIYGMKTVVDINDIFNKCKDQAKNVLVLGRAGIGKSTFCQYVAYRWAIGAIWSQYDLLVLISLRSLTESRYPPLAPGTSYTLIDLLKKEYFGHGLPEKDDRLLREQFGKSQVLWLLDGYDEIVQNVPGHLQYLVEQLLKTPHHIVTSRPYLNKLSYSVQLEITGFTDDNIAEYVKQFFDQTGDATHESTSAGRNLLSFLKLNPSIWGVAHIPINLELICSVWSDTDWSETKMLTMTALYDCITEWLCRRYLTKQNVDIQMTKEDIYADCHKELAFLETLTFIGMENNTIILRKDFLKKALKEAEYSSKNYARLLNIGMLNSINNQSIGNQIEVQKDHYFIHLSFQEHFAARYLMKALNGSERQTAIDFIKSHKYNQRFQLVLIFTSGLLIQTNHASGADTFWDIILEEPSDLVGLRHIQLIISCMEETTTRSSFPRRNELMDSVTKGLIIAASMKHDIIYKQLNESLRRSTSLVQDSIIQDTLIKLLESQESNTINQVLSLISQLSFFNPSSQLIHLLLHHLGDEQWYIRQKACEALLKLGAKVATDDVINRLVTALADENHNVRMSACDTLGKMGEKAATNGVTNRLIVALGDESEYVRRKACEALGDIGEKATTNDVMIKLVTALDDNSADVRWRTCEAIGKMRENAASKDVMNRLVIALGDENGNVRRSASEALEKMGKKAATNDIMNRLITALGDEDVSVKRRACAALGDMGGTAATNDTINRLVIALGDENASVRESACKALGQMGENAATNDVITSLLALLGDQNGNTSWQACHALRKMGDKVATNDLINGLVTALRHAHWNVRQNACTVLGEMSCTAATNDVISGLVNALGDEYGNVQDAACKALGEMGEKVATNDVINGLITALGNVWPHVREAARKALRQMGEKAAFNDVMNTLGIAVGDKDAKVRSRACRALGAMSGKAPTNDMINRLVTALGDDNGYVRRCVCEVLGEISEKAATTDVLNRLIAALGDANKDVSQKACEALGEMGEKAATIDVTIGLVTALGDEDWNVSTSACVALGKMGEKAASSDVIHGLVNALGNKTGHVRRRACEALGKIGEKAPNNDVINGLVTAVGDADMSVRESACQVLGRMSEKAATDDVINGLLNARCRVIGYSSANETLEKVLLSFSGLTQLSSDTVSKLFENIKEGQFGALRTVPPDQFVKVFLHTKGTVWLPVVTVVALLQGNAVTITGNTIVVYGSQEPIKLSVPDEELCKVLVQAFVHQAEELESSSVLLAKPKVVSSVCVLM